MAKKRNPTVSKMEAVRQTLVLGIDKSADAVAHIKEKFGIEIPAAVFSSYKSAINSTKRERKPETIVTLVRDVKRLVDAYGAESVKGMADVFAG